MILMLSQCTTVDKNEIVHSEPLVFITWENPCFDRCASIWLIRNFVDSSAIFEFLPFGSRVNKGIPFDVPGSELGRQRNISCFESIINKYNLTDPALSAMAKIIHDIDVNKWGPKMTVKADSFVILFENIRILSKDDKECVDKSSEILGELYQLNRIMMDD